MVSPYWFAPAVSQGRITPQHVTPDHGDYVFCLGYDDLDPLPTFLLNVGETIEVQQDADLTDMRTITFMWKMRTPDNMPQFRTALSAGHCIFKTGSLYETGDGLNGIELDSALLIDADNDQQMVISGSAAPANNGTFRVASLCSDLKKAHIENGSIVDTDEASITVKINGCRWVARAYIDTNLRAELVEPAGHEVQRQFVLHVSQLGGGGTIRFVLALEAVTA